jgi:hypothetical protein
MINHVRKVTGKSTGFKSVIGATDWLDDFLQEINKRGEACAPYFIIKLYENKPGYYKHI